jgi:hypothetical protein
MGDKVVSHRDLEVYMRAFMAAMQTLVGMINHSESWVIPSGQKQQ